MKITLATNEIQLRHQLELALESLGECYQAKNLTKKKLIEIALRKRHRSILEHFDLVFRLRSISYCAHAQSIRHRHASFMVQSQRYTSSNDVVNPFMGVATEYYFREVAKNICGEVRFFESSEKSRQATRYLKPQGTAINMTIKLNLRSFLELIEKRDVDGAMPETRTIVQSMREECVKSEVLKDFIAGHAIVRASQEIADKWLQENWNL